MSKSTILFQLKKQHLVAVVRGNTKEEGLQTSIACIQGGITCIEVAYTNAHANAIIQELTQTYAHESHVCIGAGTVLDAQTARMAIIAGAQYIVSPSFHLDTAIMCNRYNIAYIPGCMTPTEIVTAMEAGCEMIKLFPGSAFSPKYISSIKAPLPHATMMVTGGVNLENAKQWLDAGADAIGIGGELNKLAELGDFDTITEIAQKFVLAIQ